MPGGRLAWTCTQSAHSCSPVQILNAMVPEPCTLIVHDGLNPVHAFVHGSWTSRSGTHSHPTTCGASQAGSVTPDARRIASPRSGRRRTVNVTESVASTLRPRGQDDEPQLEILAEMA